MRSVARGRSGSPVVYVTRVTPSLSSAREHAPHGREYPKPDESRRNRTTTACMLAPWRRTFQAASISA